MSIVYIRFPRGGSSAWTREPALENLLLHASPAVMLRDWREDAFSVMAPGLPMPSVGPCVLRAQCGDVSGKWACLATPMHLVAGVSSVAPADDEMPRLLQDELDGLAVRFNARFADSGAHLVATRAAALLCVVDRPLEVATHDPDELRERGVFECQPAGRDGAALRRLMSEIEMWLFEEPLNAVRRAEGRSPVTSLWLWGGGAPLDEPVSFPAWTAGRDALFDAVGGEKQLPNHAGSGVWICEHGPGSTAWASREAGWFSEVAARLRAGRLERVDLSAGARRLSIEAVALRFWRRWRRRRARPWWDYFGLQPGQSS